MQHRARMAWCATWWWPPVPRARRQRDVRRHTLRHAEFKTYARLFGRRQWTMNTSNPEWQRHVRQHALATAPELRLAKAGAGGNARAALGRRHALVSRLRNPGCSDGRRSRTLQRAAWRLTASAPGCRGGPSRARRCSPAGARIRDDGLRQSQPGFGARIVGQAARESRAPCAARTAITSPRENSP